MGDPNRFHEFASYIRRNFPQVKTIADVAGGKGQIQMYLRPYGYDVVTFDKRKGRKDRPTMKYKYGRFDSQVKETFDLLIGMHPDQATDVIIQEASLRKIPFVIVPCCMTPTVSYFVGSCYHDWIAHLKRFAVQSGFTVTEGLLPIQGCNLILVGKL